MQSLVMDFFEKPLLQFTNRNGNGRLKNQKPVSLQAEEKGGIYFAIFFSPGA